MGVMQKAVDAVRFARTYSQHLPLAFGAVFDLQCRVLRIRGSLRGDGATVTLLYVGRRRSNLTYLLRLIFDRSAVLDEVRTVVPACRRAMARLATTCDVTIVDLGWPYGNLFNRHGAWLEMPDWINMAVVLEDDWDTVVKGFREDARRNDLRLIRRNNYRYVATTERDAIERFYDEIYVPFVRERHDADSVLAPRRHVVRQTQRGALLQVLRGEELVAAGTLYREDDVMYFLWMGVPLAHMDKPQGAVSALYYFGLRHAYDYGCYAADFTGTRAFLNDGAYRFKRKWGALVEDTFSPSQILVRPAAGSRAAAIFCERMPMLARTSEGLEAMVLFYENPLDRDDLTAVGKGFVCKGIDRINVVEVGDGEEGVEEREAEDGFRYRHIRTSLENFADWYRKAAL